MPRPDAARRDLARIRSDLAGLSLAVGLIRIERALSRKYRSDQPREPAGQPGGGRWTSGGSSATGAPDEVRDPETTGSIGGGASEDQTREEVVTQDGARVLTIRVRSNPHADWDEQHTVTAPDGTETVFENSGLTQTIRDGETGEILARSRLTDGGAEAVPFIQSARGMMPRPSAENFRALARTLEAAATTLSGVLASRENGQRKAIFAAPASACVAGDAFNERAIWVGAVDLRELDRLCPRHAEVQTVANEVAASVRAEGNYLDARGFGNKVHAVIAGIFRAKNDQTMKVETSYSPISGTIENYATRGSIRLDLIEENGSNTVCVYDHKTGQSGLSPRRSVDIITVVKKHYPHATKYIMIEVRPQS